MNIEKEIRDDHQIKLTVTFEPEVMQAAQQRAARKIAKRTKIPGFRPGKAPYAVIVRTVGEAAVNEEALDILVHEQYPKVLDEAGIKPWGPGSLQNIASLNPPVLEFVVPLDPEVVLGDYRSLRFPYEPKEITPDDVDAVIEDLRDRNATEEPVDRPAQEGDQVTVRLSAERKNPAEGQALILIKDRSTPLTIHPENDDSSSEWPFPSFSQRLMGVRPGDEMTFEYTYEGDSVLESLRGTQAIFRVMVEDIKKRVLPEIDDAFAKTLGDFETLDALRKEIHKNLVENSLQEYHQTYDNQIVDAILAGTQIKYPPQLLEREIDSFLRQLENRLAKQKLDMETYLKTRQIDQDKLREEVKPAAETRLRRSLVLFEVAEAEKIQADQSEVQNETIQTLNLIKNSYSPQEARRMVTQDFIQNMVGSITADKIVIMTTERLRAIARGENPTLEEETEAAAAPEPETEADAESEGTPSTDSLEEGNEE